MQKIQCSPHCSPSEMWWSLSGWDSGLDRGSAGSLFQLLSCQCSCSQLRCQCCCKRSYYLLKGLKDRIFCHVSDLLHFCNRLRQGNGQSLDLKFTTVDVELCGNVSGRDGFDFKSGHNCTLEHFSVYSHGSNCAQSNAGKIELHVSTLHVILSCLLPDIMLQVSEDVITLV